MLEKLTKLQTFEENSVRLAAYLTKTLNASLKRLHISSRCGWIYFKFGENVKEMFLYRKKYGFKNWMFFFYFF